MNLDAHKLPWHMDRVRAWERGERFAPVTIDMALTRRCNYRCQFCYSTLQTNGQGEIDQASMFAFLEDAASLGVHGVSLVSDGESTLNPAYAPAIQRGHALGLAMASGTNGLWLIPGRAERVMPYLTYLRVNFSAGERSRYCQIMGVKSAWFDRVVNNITYMMALKAKEGWPVTVGLQMVLRPQDSDQIMPFARLALDLGVDYGIIKHCSDDEIGSLGVDYGAYSSLSGMLHAAEALSTRQTQIAVKWSKLGQGNHRSYARCYGPPFILQFSGSGLVAPCGMLFHDRYQRFHIGNITQERFRDIWASDRYWDVMHELASERFDARTMCGSLCLQNSVNVALHQHKSGAPLVQAVVPPPPHWEFL